MFTCNMCSIDCDCVSNNPYKNNIDMNANAPEKLYFGKCDKGILDIYSNREPDDDIEYTRTDAFIEKACKRDDFIDTIEVKEVNLEEKATQLSRKYFPNEENIWARPNIEAQRCKSACIEMVEWFKAQKRK